MPCDVDMSATSTASWVSMTQTFFSPNAVTSFDSLRR